MFEVITANEFASLLGLGVSNFILMVFIFIRQMMIGIRVAALLEILRELAGSPSDEQSLMPGAPPQKKPVAAAWRPRNRRKKGAR